MEEYFDLSISATISSVSNELSNSYNTYIETLNHAQYRFYFGHKSILYTDKMREFEKNNYEYPLQKEHQMVDALMLGKLEEAKGHYQEIINQASKCSYYSMYQVLLRMSLAISSVCNRMEKKLSLCFCI